MRNPPDGDGVGALAEPCHTATVASTRGVAVPNVDATHACAPSVSDGSVLADGMVGFGF
jgi:hypothetical protein